ncbi:McrB family protein [Secundilactobacillus yichangensis]|uniref:McrB family protein n=1 Tax=Secundilactobacillus yichangensis TaxID=2799580 RepID=UPI0019408EBC|nr:AAA family ATPase [Secundilactobacillus yichangensis]
MNDADVAKFKKYLNDFLKICQRAVKEDTPEEFKDSIKNYVRGGTTKPILLSDGTKVYRHFAFGKNELFKMPYLNINWVNLYYDWSASLFEDEIPRVFIASPKIKNFQQLTGDKLTTNFQLPEDTELVGQPVTVYNIKYKVQSVDDDNISITESAYAEILKRMKKFDQLSQVQNYSEQLLQDHNVIFHGAPGTGKTYLAQSIAANLLKTNRDELMDNHQYGFVQFHPSYDYTDFVEGLRPAGIENGQLQFKLQPGTFMSFCNHAKTDPDNPYVFVIDEINRGDINKIFGELFFAIDPGYRGKASAVTTQYANLHEANGMNQQFYIPENVYIIGTMNDIDRSAENIDFAMRRRFRFIQIEPKDTLQMLNAIKDEKVRKNASDSLTRLNDKIAHDDVLNSNYEIGPSYLLRLTHDDVELEDIWQQDIAPLLAEYLQGLDDMTSRIDGFKKAFDGK